MIRAAFWAFLLCLAGCGLAGCDWVRHPDTPSETSGPRVDARDYDAFWLWAGVQPQPVLAQAKRLYILEAELLAADPGRWQSRLAATPRARAVKSPPALWISYRVETMRWDAVLYERLTADVMRYRRAGHKVAGIQIDFDAETRFLGDYASFLRDLRRRLPADVKLGITGLLDWGANGDPDALNSLGGVVDDVVLQTYQRRSTIPNYQDYLDDLDRMRIPFRIGLVQGGVWAPPASLKHNPNFRGYVVFLVNPDGPKVRP
jgi:hypothetical protein